MPAFDVTLNRKKIDTVFFDKSCSAEYVRDSLINHDGYDPNIKVRKVYEKQKYYIQRKGQGYLETVDEFDTYKEANKNLSEYILSDPSAEYYVSTRPCKEWTE